jgi:hypothetical protein
MSESWLNVAMEAARKIGDATRVAEKSRIPWLFCIYLVVVRSEYGYSSSNEPSGRSYVRLGIRFLLKDVGKQADSKKGVSMTNLSRVSGVERVRKSELLST